MGSRSAIPPASLETAWRAFGGSRVGLLRRCTQLSGEAGAPSLIIVSSEVAATSLYTAQEPCGATGAIGTSLEEAMLGAVGEAIERYCGAYFDASTSVVASKAELGDAAVGLDEFAFFHEAQYRHEEFPFARWSLDSRIRWVAGRSLITQRTRYVPACTTYVGYKPRDKDDDLFHAVSTGQACHSDRARALLSGLCEVVERDALMITWLRSLSIPRVDYRVDDEIRNIFETRVAPSGAKVHAFDMTFDMGLPTFLCIAETMRRGQAIFAAGAATSGSATRAMRKAMLESVHSLSYASSLFDTLPDWRPAPDWQNVVTFRDHVRLFATPEARGYLSFLLDQTEVRPLTTSDAPNMSAADALSDALERVARLGLDVIAVDLTTADVRACGHHVTKIFIPGAVPLTASVPALGSPRLRTVPAKLGLRSSRGNAFNHIPHPFP